MRISGGSHHHFWLQQSRAQHHLQNLTRTFYNLPENKFRRDVRIFCSDGQIIYANSQILSLGSLVFRNLLDFDCRCASYFDIVQDIICPDFSGKTLGKVVSSLQTGASEVECLSATDVEEIRSILETFQIFALIILDIRNQPTKDEAVDNISNNEHADDDLNNKTNDTSKDQAVDNIPNNEDVDDESGQIQKNNEDDPEERDETKVRRGQHRSRPRTNASISSRRSSVDGICGSECSKRASSFSSIFSCHESDGEEFCSPSTDSSSTDEESEEIKLIEKIKLQPRKASKEMSKKRKGSPLILDSEDIIDFIESSSEDESLTNANNEITESFDIKEEEEDSEDEPLILKKYDEGLRRSRFQCNQCQSTFLHRYGLNKHLLVHKSFERCKENDLESQCEKAPKDASELKQGVSHNRRELIVTLKRCISSLEDAKSFKCSQCNEDFRTEISLKEHVEKEHKDKMQCNQCEDNFENETELEEHVHKVHTEWCLDEEESAEEIMLVPVRDQEEEEMEIDEQTNQDYNEVNSEDVAFSENIQQTSTCGRQSSSKNINTENPNLHDESIDSVMLKMPSKEEMKENLQKCKTCSKEFLEHDQLKNHELSHQKNILVECHICQQVYKTMKGLKYHRLSAHNIETRHSCDICNFIFNSNLDFKQHQLEMHNSRDEDEFSSRDEISSSSDHPGQCNICGKRFSRLEHHILGMHKKELLSLVQHGGYNTTTGASNFHTVVKDFKLENISSDLVTRKCIKKEHLKTDEENQPSKRILRNKSNNSNRSSGRCRKTVTQMQQHILSSHGKESKSQIIDKDGQKSNKSKIKPGTCTICDKTVTNLQHHLRIVHKKDMDSKIIVKTEQKLTDSNRGPGTCTICGKTVTKLQRHILAVHKKEINSKIINKVGLKLNVISRGPGTCTICGKTVTQLQRHILAVHKKEVNSKIIDKVELKSNTNSKNLCGLCIVCGKTVVHLKRHILAVHKKEIRSKIIDKYGHKLNISSSGAVPGTCNICGKTVIRLQRHIEAVHRRVVISKIVDNVEPKTNTNSSNIPGTCKICGKSVVRLQRHIEVVHSKEVNSKIVNKVEPKSNMNSTNAPGTCTVCGKRVSRLKRHMQTVHMRKVHTSFSNHPTPIKTEAMRPQCNLCRDTFCSRASLVRHKIRIHNLKPKTNK